jgi:hypothetical protein
VRSSNICLISWLNCYWRLRLSIFYGILKPNKGEDLWTN